MNTLELSRKVREGRWQKTNPYLFGGRNRCIECLLTIEKEKWQLDNMLECNWCRKWACPDCKLRYKWLKIYVNKKIASVMCRLCQAFYGMEINLKAPLAPSYRSEREELRN